jgi:hypothetical protein
MLVRQSSEGCRIEHVRTNRYILGESDARHCHRPGTWQMGVHHDLSPSGLGAAGDRRVTQQLWPNGTSTVLGIDLKCSESRLPVLAVNALATGRPEGPSAPGHRQPSDPAALAAGVHATTAGPGSPPAHGCTDRCARGCRRPRVSKPHPSPSASGCSRFAARSGCASRSLQ